MTSSELSNFRYGYDFVVAVTQESINIAIKDFLSKLQESVVRVCYMADAKGNPVQGDFTKLGTDPFKIQSIGRDVDDNADIQKPNKARFIRGFEARLGLPSMSDPTKIPNLVKLGFQTSAVDFLMMCSRFTIVHEYEPGHRWERWIWISTTCRPGKNQKHGEPGFQCTTTPVRFKQCRIGSDTAQNRRCHRGSQDNASRNLSCKLLPRNEKGWKPTPGLYHQEGIKLIEADSHTDSNGKPIEDPTDVQQSAATLNYLCAADGAKLPPAVPFTWNWVDASELDNHHGVIAINRKSFAKYIEHNLESFVRVNCIDVIQTVRYLWDVVKVSYNHKIIWLDSSTKIDWVRHETGSKILSFKWHKSHEDSTMAGVYYMRMENTYTVDVESKDKTIVITQDLKFRLKIKKDGAWKDAMVIDKEIIDASTLGVDKNGEATAQLTSIPNDQSETGKIDDISSWFTGFNTLMDEIKGEILPEVSLAFGDIPVSIVSNYVFPGGNTFILKDIRFSSNQDLIASSTYGDK
ncbi:uncharacterized protein N7483_000578 [Penicillium malachiteum]|uniref:uncharacterized protein n=1 Tax=Penicillium malachiteum TaxID=1324776 RepID=UPI00254808A0|nr:uncharacterized protein N7483_000578 [Penicillium malachiteum]KAJ5735453.1 hypothetical protein N7483_000578 [Penicillium malachiteum]